MDKVVKELVIISWESSVRGGGRVGSRIMCVCGYRVVLRVFSGGVVFDVVVMAVV